MKPKEIIESELRRCRGHRSGISSEELALRAGVSERQARDLVSMLVDKDRLPIGSHPAWGFFWIETLKDQDLATRPWW
jgi:hypothetical protein